MQPGLECVAFTEAPMVLQEMALSASQSPPEAAASISPPADIGLDEPAAASACTAPTLAQLKASLVMVPAKSVYHVKRKKGGSGEAS